MILEACLVAALVVGTSILSTPEGKELDDKMNKSLKDTMDKFLDFKEKNKK